MLEEKKRKKMPLWLIIVIIIIAIGVVSSLGNSNKKDNDNQNKKKELTLEDGWTASIDSTGYFYYVEGYINNPTNKDYNYVQVTFTSYDNEGNTLGTCIDNNSGLEKDGRWKFKATCLESANSIANVKLKEITGW